MKRFSQFCKAAGLALLWSLPAAAAYAESSTQVFVEQAGARHGDFGRRAAEFLVANMPEEDRVSLSAEFLLENLRLALAAREKFAWAKTLPEERFFNEVLPYAVLDERREPWRAGLLATAEPLVAGCTTAAEAAQALNQKLFPTLRVHYHTERERPNQSPGESMAQGRATCSGLSILLVDACRAVGVPARAAGVAEWTGKPGNHTWVEVWDGEWRFTGADEYDPQGLNRGWFVADAAKAVAGDPRHAVWASSWERGRGFFPLVWNLEHGDVPGVNVTARYAPAEPAPAAAHALLHLRVLDPKAGGDARITVAAEVLDERGQTVAAGETKAGTADRNDMADFRLAPGRYTWRLRRGDEIRALPLRVEGGGERTVELPWPEPAAAKEASLSQAEAARALEEAWGKLRQERLEECRTELASGSLTAAGQTMKFDRQTYGEEPPGGHSLWISLHGGGNAPAAVNDQQFRNQIKLYDAKEGVWVVPRAPTNTWNLWHEAHIDPLFSQIIEDHLVAGGINPNRVYLLGYSAGGDGVYQLAPRMADRFAAAAMMAGHPNDASPLGLRNLPFAIFVGGDDTAYRRNEIAREWGVQLDALAQGDPGAYVHALHVYEGLGHWMNRRDGEALPWMMQFTRQPWPRRVVWKQDDVTHPRFYWLTVPPEDAKAGQLIRADVEGQTIRLATEGVRRLGLRLSDALLDLDRPVTVLINGQPLFQGRIPRTRATIDESLQKRADPTMAATAVLSLEW